MNNLSLYKNYYKEIAEVLKVGVGTIKIDDYTNGAIHNISYVAVHENFEFYNEKRYHSLDDIALVRVTEPIQFNERVDKITLQTEKDTINYTSAVLTGWGLYNCQVKLVRFFFKQNYREKKLFVNKIFYLLERYSASCKFKKNNTRYSRPRRVQ